MRESESALQGRDTATGSPPYGPLAPVDGREAPRSRCVEPVFPSIGSDQVGLVLLRSCAGGLGRPAAPGLDPVEHAREHRVRQRRLGHLEQRVAAVLHSGLRP